MRIDIHVHISATHPAKGKMSQKLLRSTPFRFMNWALGVGEPDAGLDYRLEQLLARTIQSTPELDAAVVLAFDAVYTKDGQLDHDNTHLQVTNDYVIDLCKRHQKMLFGASVHPYRKDAIAELERCIAAGAVLMKWLPITQGIDPSDPICYPFYEALAHYRLPLLSHTGWEKTLPNLNRLADPTLLQPALRRGVQVIAAHCGTRSTFWESDYSHSFIKMALDHEHFYGDTAALNLPTRSYVYKQLFKDDKLRRKILHGSDWPVLSLPPIRQLGIETSLRMMEEENWMRRDILIKQKLGFEEDYWTRAKRVLKLT